MRGCTCSTPKLPGELVRCDGDGNCVYCGRNVMGKMNYEEWRRFDRNLWSNHRTVYLLLPVFFLAALTCVLYALAYAAWHWMVG